MAPSINTLSLERIIVQGDAEVLVNQAKDFGESMQTTGLTKSQIRGIFGTVRQIQASWDNNDAQQNMRKVLLLKPRLAYQGTREAKVKPLAEVLSNAIDLVAADGDETVQVKRFGYFVDLFEAILAYHTAAGGK